MKLRQPIILGCVIALGVMAAPSDVLGRATSEVPWLDGCYKITQVINGDGLQQVGRSAEIRVENDIIIMRDGAIPDSVFPMKISEKGKNFVFAPPQLLKIKNGEQEVELALPAAKFEPTENGLDVRYFSGSKFARVIYQKVGSICTDE